MAYSIQIKPDSLFRYKSGRVTGIIFLSDESCSYPDNEWNDFVVIVLKNWVSSLLNTIVLNNDVCTWYFMDGPFSLSLCIKYYTKGVEIIFHERNEPVKEIGLGYISFDDILTSFDKSIIILERFYLSNNYHLDSEFILLKQNFIKLLDLLSVR